MCNARTESMGGIASGGMLKEKSLGKLWNLHYRSVTEVILVNVIIQSGSIF